MRVLGQVSNTHRGCHVKESSQSQLVSKDKNSVNMPAKWGNTQREEEDVIVISSNDLWSGLVGVVSHHVA